MHRRIRFRGWSLCLVTALLLLACSLGGPHSSSTRAVSADTAIDQLVEDVLVNMQQHSWNPHAMTRGVVTGGLYINWKMSDPSITNAVRPGRDGNPQHNHDPQVDLFYLTTLAQYHQLHPLDHRFDADLARMIPVVLADFGAYSVPKGWIYFYLLHDGLLLHHPGLVAEAHTVANNFFQRWYDPRLGVVYDKKHTPGDYAVDHSLMCGAALIDAGQRWNEPTWIKAGTSTLDHILAVAIDPSYQLFYNSMLVKDDGHDVAQNSQAKPSTQGQSVDALVTAYTLTHNAHYLDVAGQVLLHLFSSGMWDSTRGGLFFAIDMKDARLLSAYKETRSQSLTLLALHHFNQVRPQLTQQELKLSAVLASHFYQATYHGFFYRVTPDFEVYVSRPHGGIGVEDFFTTEAMGSALDALQTTELP